MAHRILITLAALLIPSLSLLADDGFRSRADKHAPASLMGDHVHDCGELMVEYKDMIMSMNGNRAGTNRLNDSDAVLFGATSNPVTNRGASPTNMTMEMHMLHLMYGYSVSDESGWNSVGNRLVPCRQLG
ncbi:MAG: hypothetical protein MI861_17735 [Pirellulales bacterium]|nr:hypothetical protein [Pirellulales bacterium]